MGFLLLPVIGPCPKPAKLTLLCTEQHLAHNFSLFFLSNFFSIAFYTLFFVSASLGLAPFFTSPFLKTVAANIPLSNWLLPQNQQTKSSFPINIGHWFSIFAFLLPEMPAFIKWHVWKNEKLTFILFPPPFSFPAAREKPTHIRWLAFFLQRERW